MSSPQLTRLPTGKVEVSAGCSAVAASAVAGFVSDSGVEDSAGVQAERQKARISGTSRDFFMIKLLSRQVTGSAGASVMGVQSVEPAR